MKTLIYGCCQGCLASGAPGGTGGASAAGGRVMTVGNGTSALQGRWRRLNRPGSAQGHDDAIDTCSGQKPRSPCDRNSRISGSLSGRQRAGLPPSDNARNPVRGERCLLPSIVAAGSGLGIRREQAGSPRLSCEEQALWVPAGRSQACRASLHPEITSP